MFRRSPSSGKLAGGLEGDRAVAALIDSLAYVRTALGADSERDRVRREVLLAVAYAGCVGPREVAEMLGRDSSTVRRQLAALRKGGLLASRPDPNEPKGLRWHLTSTGQFTATNLRAVAVSCAQLAEDTENMLSARKRMPAPPLGVAPVRVRVPGGMRGGEQVQLSSRRDVGQRLAELRRVAGWRQGDLAAAAEVSVREVRRLEGGLERQDVLSLLACCRALGARLADVVAR